MRKALFFISFILLYCPILVPSPNYSFKQITITEGLTQSTVNSLLLDSKGIFWIGTKSGLNRFAKRELTTFLNDRTKKYSLPDNNIQFVAEDSEHNIWVSTEKGLTIYDSFKNEFNPIIRGTIYSYLLLKDGILFGGREMLYKYSYEKKNVVRIPFVAKKGSPSIYYNIVKLIKLDEKRVLIGTRNMGIYIYTTDTYEFKPLINVEQKMLLSLCLSSDGLIYASLFGDGVSCYNKEGKLLDKYSLPNSSINSNIILDITEKDGKLWMATDGAGINILDTKTKQFTEMRHVPGDKNSLPGNSITVLYKDATNNLWAGSVRGGAFSITETFIKTYTEVSLNNTSGLSEKAVISIYEDDGGILWVGTDGGGINSYNFKTKKFTHYPSTYGDKVASIAGISDNELLLSLYGEGLSIFDTNTKRLRPFIIEDAATSQIEYFSGYLPLAHKVTDNKIYILSYNPWVYHIKEKKFSQIVIGDKNLPSDGLILTYSNDSISYVMRENQLFEINQKNDSLSLLVSLDPKDIINSACYDGKQYIWIASTIGLIRYDVKTKELKPIQTKLFHSISYIFIDKKKRLWISAQNMLFSYLPDEDRFLIWSEIDGFTPNEILFMHQTQSKYGNIYMGGSEGLVKIDENIVYDDSPDSKVQLADIIFNGRSYIGKMQDETIEIPWDYNSLTISINLNERDIFRKTMYRFFITGSNEQFVETYDPSISLTSLSPGKYTIQVSHNGRDGSYNEPSKLVDVVIVPPWYNRSWVITASILIMILLIMLVVRFVIWRSKEALRWEKKEYEQQMNEEKINFLVNISHELRTPLTLIYAPLQRLIDESKERDATKLTDKLSLIYKQAWQMKNIVNMVLDINRLNATEDSIRKQSCYFNSWVKGIVEEFNNEWNDKNITIILELDERIENVFMDEWKCQIVLSNLLMNALKFSESNTQITISTILKEEMVRLEVSDQGIGLQNEDIGKLFDRFYQGKHNKIGTGIGLSYSKTLIEKHRGNIGAYNNIDRGATFYFEIPSGLEDYSLLLGNDVPITQVSNIDSISSDFSCSELSILIVEDELDLRLFLEEIFISRFKHVYTSDNGLNALEECRTKQPDIVISDVMMPKMDGYEFCRNLKLNLEISHIPVVLLTARSDQDSVTFGYKQGADAYITKPFDQDRLFAIISNLLRSREAIRERYKRGSITIFPQESTISKRDEEFMAKLDLVINENIADPEFSINQLVAEMAVSRASLYNKLKAVTGMGVNDYINRIRIEKASSLLKNSELSIKEIAFEVGFAYSRHFSTTFKEKVGMTPTEFREKKFQDDYTV